MAGAAGLGGLAGLAGCGDEVPVFGTAGPVSVMTYNLAGAEDGWRAQALADRVAVRGPELVALQECVGCDGWLARELDGAFAVTALRAGVAVAYDRSLWDAAEEGWISLGEDDDGWGERGAAWSRLERVEDGTSIYLYSTHWCVPIRRPDDGCTAERQVDYARAVVDHIAARAHPQVPVVLAGDLNVFDGFEDALAMRELRDAGLVDVLRVVDPVGVATTFEGNDWAPPGRIDYILAAAPVRVLSAAVDRDPADDGASDHHPVLATLAF
ncbi:MAG TPA: endonuclease/exonuclease/phosphatase family protein [Kofleriaceae bacterium]|nr:endonuclease/exonuclease/phosphatase family protein [Kofleriaceae bacterium]